MRHQEPHILEVRSVCIHVTNVAIDDPRCIIDIDLYEDARAGLEVCV